ncbi:hypothetical protein ACFV1N_46105 [Streptosporangium canum]|uniref:hypothetical protein n=1 Tax=Streptosporangium canum TaxID=324952 RepID=UPI0036881B86
MPTRTTRMVSAAEMNRRVEEILNRRARYDDPDLEAASDEPLELVAYVLEHRRVPDEVLRHDVEDALVLLEYGRHAIPALPGRLDRLEHRLMTLGVETGLSLGELAAALGLRSRQAVQHRLLRHAAAERGSPRSEVAERAARRAEARERTWLERNGTALLACTEEMISHHDQLAADPEISEAFDDLAESLSRVPADSRNSRYAIRIRHLAARLRLLLADLNAIPAPAAIAADQSLHTLLTRTARLATAHQAASSPDE